MKVSPLRYVSNRMSRAHRVRFPSRITWYKNFAPDSGRRYSGPPSRVFRPLRRYRSLGSPWVPRWRSSPSGVLQDSHPTIVPYGEWLSRGLSLPPGRPGLLRRPRFSRRYRSSNAVARPACARGSARSLRPRRVLLDRKSCKLAGAHGHVIGLPPEQRGIELFGGVLVAGPQLGPAEAARGMLIYMWHLQSIHQGRLLYRER